jgi:YbbR domain-containing protein
VSWFRNLGLKLLAVLGAFLLWGISHNRSSKEIMFDVPILVSGVPDDLVLTERSANALNVRVRGSRAVMRNLNVEAITYPVDLAGVGPGPAHFEVPTEAIVLPAGLEVLSRSPSSLDYSLERKTSKWLPVRPDVEGVPAIGFEMRRAKISPAGVRVTGARPEVLRLREVLTETIDVSGLAEPVERRVRLSPPGRHVWAEGNPEFTVTIDIQPAPEPPAETPAEETQP